MPLDPVLVLVVVDDEARLVIPLLQPLHRHPAVVLGTSQSEPPLLYLLYSSSHPNIVQAPRLQTLVVVWLPLARLARAAPEGELAGGVGRRQPGSSVTLHCITNMVQCGVL